MYHQIQYIFRELKTCALCFETSLQWDGFRNCFLHTHPFHFSFFLKSDKTLWHRRYLQISSRLLSVRWQYVWLCFSWLVLRFLHLYLRNSQISLSMLFFVSVFYLTARPKLFFFCFVGDLFLLFSDFWGFPCFNMFFTCLNYINLLSPLMDITAEIYNTVVGLNESFDYLGTISGL